MGMHPLSFSIPLISELLCAMKDRNPSLAYSVIEKILLHGVNPSLPHSYLRCLQTSLINQDLESRSKAFTSGSFIGKNGNFLWIAPYRFKDHSSTALLGIMGRIVPLISPLANASIPKATLPIETYVSFGPSPELDETPLLLSNRWEIPGCHEGPDLLNLTAEQNTIKETLRLTLVQLFTPKCAAILNSWTSNRMILNSTLFELHQLQALARSKSGPIHEKIRSNLDHAGKVIALEEWKNDGMTINLALKSLGPRKACYLSAALLSKRLGSLFSGASPSLPIHLDRLLKSGFLKVTDDLKLDLHLHSILDLPRVFEATLNQSSLLTKKPYPSFLGDPHELATNLIRHLKQKRKTETNTATYSESTRLESNPTR